MRPTNQRGPNARMVQRPPSAGQSESGTAISGRNLCCGLRVFGMRSGIIVPISQLHNSQNHTPLFRQIASFLHGNVKVHFVAETFEEVRTHQKKRENNKQVAKMNSFLCLCATKTAYRFLYLNKYFICRNFSPKNVISAVIKLHAPTYMSFFLMNLHFHFHFHLLPP